MFICQQWEISFFVQFTKYSSFSLPGLVIPSIGTALFLRLHVCVCTCIIHVRTCTSTIIVQVHMLLGRCTRTMLPTNTNQHCEERVQPGAYERRSREGACNYRLHLGAIQIQIISQLTSKYGNHSFNQASE